MKKIELFEKAIREKAASLKDYGINGTAFRAYRNSIESENEVNCSRVRLCRGSIKGKRNVKIATMPAEE